MSLACATRAQSPDRAETATCSLPSARPLTLSTSELAEPDGDRLESSAREGDVLVFRIRKR